MASAAVQRHSCVRNTHTWLLILLQRPLATVLEQSHNTGFDQSYSQRQPLINTSTLRVVRASRLVGIIVRVAPGKIKGSHQTILIDTGRGVFTNLHKLLPKIRNSGRE